MPSLSRSLAENSAMRVKLPSCGTESKDYWPRKTGRHWLLATATWWRAGLKSPSLSTCNRSCQRRSAGWWCDPIFATADWVASCWKPQNVGLRVWARNVCWCVRKLRARTLTGFICAKALRKRKHRLCLQKIYKFSPPWARVFLASYRPASVQSAAGGNGRSQATACEQQSHGPVSQAGPEAARTALRHPPPFLVKSL